MKKKQAILNYQEFLNAQNAQETVLFQKTKYTLERNMGVYQINADHKFSTSDLSKSVPDLEQFAEDFETFKLKPELKFLPDLELRTGLGAGDLFPKIENLTIVYGDGKTVLEHKPGEILAIQFWATWCGYCQQPMANNHNMMVNNEKNWTGKVRIFGLSLDETKERVIQRVDERKWHKVEHLWIGPWKMGHDSIRTFQIDGVPKFFIVDREGRLAFVGSPMQIKVEDKINELLFNESVDEAAYKTSKAGLKNKLLEVLNDKSLRQNKINLSLIWNKEKVFQTADKMKKVVYKKPQLTISYVLKDKDIVDKIMAMLPKTIEVVNDCNDPKLIPEKCNRFLRKEMQEHDLEDINIKFSKEITLGINDKKPIDKKTALYLYEGVISSVRKENVKKFNVKVDEFIQRTENSKSYLEKLKLKCGTGDGDSFIPFLIEDVFKDETSTLIHSNKEILIIYFWASWAGNCFDSMATFERLLDKNKPLFGANVRIVAVSVFDSSKTSIIDKINSKKWSNVVQCLIPLNCERAQRGDSLYGVQGIPCMVLIDSTGKVRYKGHPKVFPLEKALTYFLQEKLKEEQAADDSKDTTVVESKNVDITREQFKNLKRFLSNEGKDMLMQAQKAVPYPIKFIASFKKEYEVSTQETNYEKPTIEFTVRQPEEGKINALFPESLCPRSSLLLKPEILKTVTLFFGTNCSVCQVALKPTDFQYVCRECKVYFCATCADKRDSSKSGSASLCHPHNLVFIYLDSEEGLKDIDEFKFGKNITYDTNVQHFSASCNGCGGFIQNCIRWICISCRPGAIKQGGFIDCCDACIRKLMKDDEKTIRALEKSDGHLHKKHLWLRIYFGDNYYEY